MEEKQSNSHMGLTQSHPLCLRSLARYLRLTNPATLPIPKWWTHLPTKKVNSHTCFRHQTHHREWRNEIQKHILLSGWGHLQAHTPCAKTTGLRSANTDCMSKKDGSWKPHSDVPDANPAYENMLTSRCTNISAKSYFQPQVVTRARRAKLTMGWFMWIFCYCNKKMAHLLWISYAQPVIKLKRWEK